MSQGQKRHSPTVATLHEDAPGQINDLLKDHSGFRPGGGICLFLSDFYSCAVKGCVVDQGRKIDSDISPNLP